MTIDAPRVLIVNADDFGQNAGVNRGIIRAHEDGIVTSASLMVRWPGAEEAALYARTHPRIAVGLHLDLGEWYCLDGEWRERYNVVDTGDRFAVESEISRQLDSFLRLMGRAPTHIDSHQHVHLREPALSVVTEAAGRLGVPLRRCCPSIRYRGDFYGQDDEGTRYPAGISVENLLKMLTGLPPGATELGCHPGEGAHPDTTYDRERSEEVTTLCDPRVKHAIKELGITLVAFGDGHALPNNLTYG